LEGDKKETKVEIVKGDIEVSDGVMHIVSGIMQPDYMEELGNKKL